MNISPGTSPLPMSSELLLKNFLGIPSSTSRGVKQIEVVYDSPSDICVNKTNLLKQTLCKTDSKNESPSRSNVEGISPPRSKKESKKLQSCGKSPHFAGSAFQNAPHPDTIPMPDFDENFFR